jgi:hypothetical protein
MLKPMPKVQIEVAQLHLELLNYQSGDPCSFRAIRKLPDGRSEGRTIAGIYPGIPETLGDLNGEVWAIYVAVNGAPRDENVVTARAVFIEHDNLEKSIQLDLWPSLNLPEPTLQVDTGGKSIHSHWLLSTPVMIDEWRILHP